MGKDRIFLNINNEVVISFNVSFYMKNFHVFLLCIQEILKSGIDFRKIKNVCLNKISKGLRIIKTYKRHGLKSLLSYLLAGILIQVLLFSPQVAEAKTIAIDPGHGGVDTGCLSGNLFEKDIVLEVSRAVQIYLKEKGYKVILTRDSDRPLAIYSNKVNFQRNDLNERVRKINSNNADLFVSIHVNSFASDPRVNGSTVFFCNTDCVESMKLAHIMQRLLNDIRIDGVERAKNFARTENFSILKNTSMPGVLIETAFITNPREEKWISTTAAKQKIAETIVGGIEQFFNTK